jgi:hypothetical protein
VRGPPLTLKRRETLALSVLLLDLSTPQYGRLAGRVPHRFFLLYTISGACLGGATGRKEGVLLRCLGSRAASYASLPLVEIGLKGSTLLRMPLALPLDALIRLLLCCDFVWIRRTLLPLAEVFDEQS